MTDTLPPCPECGSAFAYEAGALLNCPECGHEWSPEALAEGVRSNTPVVLLCGDTRAAERENLQNIDQRAVILSSGAGFEMLHAPETALEDLARAARRALTERRPIALNMPADLLWQELDYNPVSWHVPPFPRTVLEGDALDQAIGMIAAARRPVVLAGRGAIDVASRDALIRFSRRIEAPLATTMRAKSLFRGEDHNLGVFGTVSTPQAAEAIMSADCIIAFGASLNFHTTAQGAFVKGKRVIQIADRACDLGRGAVADVPILAHPRDAAETFLHWLDEAEIAPSGFTRDLPARGLDMPPPRRPTHPREGTLDFLTTIAKLEDILPTDRLLVPDAGRVIRAPYEVPLGTVLGVLGSGVFLVLILRSRHRAA